MFFLIYSFSSFIIFDLRIHSGKSEEGGGSMWAGNQRNGGEKCMAVGMGKSLYSQQNPESQGDQARPIRYPSSGLIDGKKEERKCLF